MKENIPSQMVGAESQAGSTLTMDSAEQARNHFGTVQKRFLDINSWELFAGQSKAEFTLCDRTGNLKLELPELGDYIRIKVPVLHNPDDDGYDWVQIEHIEEEHTEDYDGVYIRVRPCAKPHGDPDKVTHFLESTATSNFIIERKGREISAEVYARNEVPNSSEETLAARLRNKIVALGGMLIGSKIQWESLTGGLIKYEQQ